ncbi:hypothetical protein GCM10023196_046940 [Actinoallomurus vinaceus]|uniref:Secreted protein n=1 Tax=Actinoallomurus vinaceus TaxID=1080074 RepID=A0ABP8UGS0_9ACTN
MTTPQRILALTGCAAVLAVVLAAVIAQGVAGLHGGLRDIGDRSGPEVVATSDAYFALNDMDAQVANVLLVGDEHNLGVGREKALGIYEQRRRQADADLQQAAAAGAGDPTAQRAIRAVLDALGRYEALTAQAILVDGETHHAAGRPSPTAVGLYRQATDLLKTQLLPAAAGLTSANSGALEQAYEAKHARAVRTAVGIALTGAVLIGVLIGLQIMLTRRFRRRFNPFLLIATLVAGIVTVAGTSTLTGEARHLRVAKKDAFDSVLALSQARAVGYDANADESRYLVDPARRPEYEPAFLAKTQQLAGLPAVTTPAGYPAALRQAWNAYGADHTDIGWSGYLGTEFRNITFPGERDLAERTLQAFLTYEQDDSTMRALARRGRLHDAIRFNTAFTPGNSNYDFDQYDKNLTALIDLNRSHFTKSIHAGEKDLNGWSLIPWAAALGVIGLAFAGVRPRLAEYR